MCSAYYFDKESGAWLTHRYSKEELEDSKTALEKDVKICLELKRCVSYENKELKETFIHRYSEEELKALGR